MNLFERSVKALERIAGVLEAVVDKKKRCIRIVDVDRGKVYSKHLGKKMTKR